nr:conidial pigment polyketide synthase alb1 [Quercus suber]
MSTTVTMERVTTLSTACQQIVISDFPQSNTARVVARSCLADRQLWPLVEGHKCNRVALCSSALYADQASQLAKFIWETLRPVAAMPGLNVCEVDIPKLLIADIPQRSQGQWLEIEAIAELPHESHSIGGNVRCTFRSVYPDGTKISDHASCTVRYESIDIWREDWSRFDHMVSSQITSLHERASSGDAHTFQRELAYKVFKSFVDYSRVYQGMKSVIMDSSTNEATAVLEFQTGPYDYSPPIILDNSCHVSGFVCNASENLAENDVFVSHGWGAMKFSKPLTADMKLVNYVRMRPKPDNILQGDVFILEEGKIIAVWEGVRFKQIPRRYVGRLEWVLSSPGNADLDVSESWISFCLRRRRRKASPLAPDSIRLSLPVTSQIERRPGRRRKVDLSMLPEVESVCTRRLMEGRSTVLWPTFSMRKPCNLESTILLNAVKLLALSSNRPNVAVV